MELGILKILVLALQISEEVPMAQLKRQVEHFYWIFLIHPHNLEYKGPSILAEIRAAV